MEKSFMKKIIILSIASTLILTLSIPTVISYNLKDYENHLICVAVLDTIEGKEKSYYVPFDELQDFLTIMNDKITANTFSQKILDKLNILKNYGMISDSTEEKLLLQYSLNEKNLNRYSVFPKPSGDTALNIFSGTFFGIKGEKESSLFEWPLIDLPFFNGNITAGLIGYGKFTGSGSVFTIGFIGFKYIYDFDNTQYEFPYFPDITGSVFGYSGILIHVLAEGPNVPQEVKGNYYIGVGMSILTNWKIQ